MIIRDECKTKTGENIWLFLFVGLLSKMSILVLIILASIVSVSFGDRCGYHVNRELCLSDVTCAWCDQCSTIDPCAPPSNCTAAASCPRYQETTCVTSTVLAT